MSIARFFRPLSRLVGTGLVIAGLMFPVMPTQPAWAKEQPNVQPGDVLPGVLSEHDIKLYRKIFEVQEKAKWHEADRLIRKLHDKILMGHVEFQRLMHPTGYRARYSELAAWMKHYADLPGAWQVYNLARKRQGHAHAPRRPTDTRYPGVTGQSAPQKPPLPHRSVLETRAVSRFFANVRYYVRKGQPERAEKRFWAMNARGLLVPYEKAEALERISASYYYDDNDDKALILGTLGANYAREIEPGNDWIAGLASWREGDLKKAYTHFNYVSVSERAGDWLTAAGHFWAARTALRLGHPAQSDQHLQEACTYVETFYGLIACRQLGIKPDIDWTVPELTRDAADRLIKHPAVRRAIALTEIGRDDIADEELRLLWGREGTSVQDDLLALAAYLNLPAIQIRLGRAGGTGKPSSTAVRYPLPDWEPAGGFTVDRALIFAMVKKESDFRIRARSHAGAGGLMQVMPATARYISRGHANRLLRRNRHRLYEPEFNMALGQNYIEYLLDADYVEGNLFMALAAYNGGPGSLMSWRKEVTYGQDPLLFIESIGFYETRSYVEKVMANLWLYRMRLGQETPSLDAVASGAWPTLEQMDTPETDDAVQRALTHTASQEANINARN
ncbi:lytic transglycosylase domain-containing protein [Kordiimonas marina]|uniref:lytic transglycosylase domain-containing protein n=1 Tax=Kordiimonas marina TaxID=2872312 RepID=UPI001FF3C354|nr:lytic transglycosylase domain-containing protein [Kordiimonas marina]